MAAQPVPASDRAVSTLEQVRLRVAARAELPPWAVKDDSRLLSDLHLSSIAVGQLVAETARSLDLAPPIEPTAFANATVAQVAEALEDLARTGNGQPAGLLTRFPPGVGPWIRSFTVDLVERPRPRQPAADAAGPWRVIAAPGHPLAEELRQAFDHARAGRGVATCLPPEPDERHVAWLLEGARALFAEQAVRPVHSRPARRRGRVIRPHPLPGVPSDPHLRGGCAGRSSSSGGMDRCRGRSHVRFHRGPL